MNEPRKDTTKETLCWDCKNYATCSWILENAPVEGWTAIANSYYMKRKNRYTTSYTVLKCPNFERDFIKLQRQDFLTLFKLSRNKFNEIKHDENELIKMAREKGFDCRVEHSERGRLCAIYLRK